MHLTQRCPKCGKTPPSNLRVAFPGCLEGYQDCPMYPIKEIAHPEDTCQRCGGRNPVWYAPNYLWNGVMGSPNGIICPTCFYVAASNRNIDVIFRAYQNEEVYSNKESFLETTFPGKFKMHREAEEDIVGDGMQEIRQDEEDDVHRCRICGGGMVLIRGKYPDTEKRHTCPTCTTERLEQIREISSKEYGIAHTEISGNKKTIT